MKVKELLDNVYQDKTMDDYCFVCIEDITYRIKYVNGKWKCYQYDTDKMLDMDVDTFDIYYDIIHQKNCVNVDIYPVQDCNN